MHSRVYTCMHVEFADQSSNTTLPSDRISDKLAVPLWTKYYVFAIILL